MQHEYPEVQPQETRMGQHLGQLAARQMTVFRRLGRDAPEHRDHTAECQGGRQHEQTRQTDRRHQQGRQHQREREHQPDARPHERHRLGPDLVASQVRQQGGDGGRHGAGALQGPADKQAVQIRGRSRHQAADREDQQTENNHPLAAQTIRGHAEGQLQETLGQPVDAHRQADLRRIVATRVSARLQGKDWQHQKQSQHAQGEDRGQRHARAALQRRHGRGRRAGG